MSVGANRPNPYFSVALPILVALCTPMYTLLSASPCRDALAEMIARHSSRDDRRTDGGRSDAEAAAAADAPVAAPSEKA